ncbi:MAG: SCO family protein [Chloroflexi bacterium]|nr:MAG: SCO family protein [Chloroflexota bacterium]
MRAKNTLPITFLFLSLLVLAGCAGTPSFHGALAEPIAPAPEIDLVDQDGNMVRLSDWSGKVVLIFFGFTNCPDECPLTAAHIKQALETMGDGARNVQVVMVSTDPVRDTPQAIKEFLGKFNPNFVGIPGTVESLSRVWDDYGVMVLHGGETHSSFIYVVDQSGKLRLTFTPDTSPGEIASDLNVLLAEQ